GDYIKLNSGEVGSVTDINWRSTTITSGANNIIIVPNANVASAIITNYEFPDKQMSLNLQITVPGVIDIDRLEKITYDVAREITGKSPGTVHEYDPSVRFQAFGENGIVLSINTKVIDFSSQYAVRHDLIKALHKRYAEEGIIVKPPARDVV
ncbi:MAG: mechanosensitive ion channel domain-containing protein, partial [Syntrophorhabdus sp.]